MLSDLVPFMPQDMPPHSAPIGIVTSFFDIGRGDWTSDKGLPGYLHRPTDTYMGRFAHLASLDNPMAIYTTPDLAPRVWSLRKGKEDRTCVVDVPFHDMFHGMREVIAKIQTDPDYKSKINPKEARNPEYWSSDYVLVCLLKSAFVTDAIQKNLIAGDSVAWVDFGYCREVDALGGKAVWRYPFAPDKMHVFSFGPYKGYPSIAQIVFNNVLCLAGGVIVGSRDLWPEFAALINRAFCHLQEGHLMDDDQTMMFMATLYKPELFEQHVITETDCLHILKKYNL